MDPIEHESATAQRALDACVEHARRMLVSQLPILESRNYDFMPHAKELIIQSYLTGTMWRFGEQFELPTTARDRGFICLMAMLIADGMGAEEAQNRMAQLHEMSVAAEDRNGTPFIAGYRAEVADGSLAHVFENLSTNPGMSGAPYRLLARSKLVGAILAGAGLLVSLILGKTWGEALGVGLVLGLTPIAIALAIFWQTVKAKR